jgi:energy-coupling factor transporter ATP-binding protein EcfA2
VGEESEGERVSKLTIREISPIGLYGFLPGELKLAGLTEGLNVVYGRNGSGKSTLARAIRLALRPSECEIGVQVEVSGSLGSGASKGLLHRQSAPILGTPPDRPQDYFLDVVEMLNGLSSSGKDDDRDYLSQILGEGVRLSLVYKAPDAKTYRGALVARDEWHKRRKSGQAIGPKEQRARELENEISAAEAADGLARALEGAVELENLEKEARTLAQEMKGLEETYPGIENQTENAFGAVQNALALLKTAIRAEEERRDELFKVVRDGKKPQEQLSLAESEQLTKCVEEVAEVTGKINELARRLAEQEQAAETALRQIRHVADDAPVTDAALTADELQSLSVLAQRDDAVRQKRELKAAIDRAAAAWQQRIEKLQPAPTRQPQPDGQKHQLSDSVGILIQWLQAEPTLEGTAVQGQVGNLRLALAVTASLVVVLLLPLEPALRLGAGVLAAAVIAYTFFTAGKLSNLEAPRLSNASRERLNVEQHLGSPATVSTVVERLRTLFHEHERAIHEDALEREKGKMSHEIEIARHQAREVELRNVLAFLESDAKQVGWTESDIEAWKTEIEAWKTKFGLNVATPLQLEVIAAAYGRWTEAVDAQKRTSSNLDTARRSLADARTRIDAIYEAYGYERKKEIEAEGCVGSFRDWFKFSKEHDDALGTYRDRRDEFDRAVTACGGQGEGEPEARIDYLKARAEQAKTYQEYLTKSKDVKREIERKSIDAERLAQAADEFPFLDLEGRLDHYRLRSETLRDLRQEKDKLEWDVDAFKQLNDVADAERRYGEEMLKLQTRCLSLQADAINDEIVRALQERVKDSAPDLVKRANEHLYGVQEEDRPGFTDYRYSLQLDSALKGELGPLKIRDHQRHLTQTFSHLNTSGKVHVILALRLALIDQHETAGGQGAIRYPLIVDELMAVSDSAATEALAHALKLISESRQVIAFTNQRDDVRALKAAAGEVCNIVSIGRDSDWNEDEEAHAVEEPVRDAPTRLSLSTHINHHSPKVLFPEEPDAGNYHTVEEYIRALGLKAGSKRRLRDLVEEARRLLGGRRSPLQWADIAEQPWAMKAYEERLRHLLVVCRNDGRQFYEALSTALNSKDRLVRVRGENVMFNDSNMTFSRFRAENVQEFHKFFQGEGERFICNFGTKESLIEDLRRHLRPSEDVSLLDATAELLSPLLED